MAEYVEKDLAAYPSDAFRLAFTSNHDENSWAGTEFERMGDAYKALSVLTFTLPRTQALIYTGQEMGWNHRFLFFEKDPIPAWETNEYTDFYKELISLKHRNPALAAGKDGGSYELLKADASEFVFSRTVPGNKVTVRVELVAPYDYEIIEEHQGEHIERLEPLSWWVGMNTPLQLLIKGDKISDYDVSIKGGKDVRASAVHKAESPNYLFVDVEIGPKAQAGEYKICFSRGGKVEFEYPYTIAERREGSASRESFTSSDLIYLIMPDRFANGDALNDSDSRTFETADKNEFFGRRSRRSFWGASTASRPSVHSRRTTLPRLHGGSCGRWCRGLRCAAWSWRSARRSVRILPRCAARTTAVRGVSATAFRTWSKRRFPNACFKRMRRAG